MNRLIALLLFLGLEVVAVASPQAFRLLVVADRVDAKIGPTVALDAERVIKFFQDLFNDPRLPRFKQIPLTIHQFGIDGNTNTPKAISPASLRAYFQNYPLGWGESLIFYYSGHGGYAVPERGDQGYFLGMSGGNISVKEIMERAKQNYSAANIFFVIDACGSFSSARIYQVEEYSELTYDVRLLEQVYADLFLDSVGGLELFAAKPGQYAISAKQGSLMTTALMSALRPKAVLGADINRDGKTSWEELLHLTALGTNRSFREQFPNGLEGGQMSQEITYPLEPSLQNGQGVLSQQSWSSEEKMGLDTEVLIQAWKGTRVYVCLYGFSDKGGVLGAPQPIAGYTSGPNNQLTLCDSVVPHEVAIRHKSSFSVPKRLLPQTNGKVDPIYFELAMVTENGIQIYRAPRKSFGIRFSGTK